MSPFSIIVMPYSEKFEEMEGQKTVAISIQKKQRKICFNRQKDPEINTKIFLRQDSNFDGDTLIRIKALDCQDSTCVHI